MLKNYIIEEAAKAAYEKTREFAPKYYTDPETLDRYVPWDETSESWRKDYKETIAAALIVAIENFWGR